LLGIGGDVYDVGYWLGFVGGVFDLDDVYDCLCGDDIVYVWIGIVICVGNVFL